MKINLIAALLILLSSTSYAAEGHDIDSSAFIEIEPGNTIEPGHDIEVYNYDTGEYKFVTVDSVNDNGSTVMVEISTSTSTSTLELNK